VNPVINDVRGKKTMGRKRKEEEKENKVFNILRYSQKKKIMA
jgi:hypothetical protein